MCLTSEANAKATARIYSLLATEGIHFLNAPNAFANPDLHIKLAVPLLCNTNLVQEAELWEGPWSRKPLEGENTETMTLHIERAEMININLAAHGSNIGPLNLQFIEETAGKPSFDQPRHAIGCPADRRAVTPPEQHFLCSRIV